MYVAASSLQSQPPIVYIIFLLVTLAPLYNISYQYHLRHPYGQSLQIYEPANPSSPAFIRDWLALVFNLADANGGTGNIRGNMLDFLFQSIEAGASIILPGMASCSNEDLSNVWASRAPFDEFFDEEWFWNTMTEACPEMAVYKPQPNQPLKEAVPGHFHPQSRRVDADFDNNKKGYLEGLQTFLDESGRVEPDGLTLVNLERTLWDIDTRSLPEGFRRNFGQLLRINPTIRRLAAVVVQPLSLQYSIDIDPRDAVPKRAFYGAHLRTEADAQNAGWLGEGTNFTVQTDTYIQHALKHKLKVIYVASGNATDLALFQQKAFSHAPPLNVTSKYDLLPPNEAAALKELTWDQQALVDYKVLQRCSIFGGFVKSSFSYNIAMTRNQWLDDQGRIADPWMVQHSEDGVSFDDGISRFLGRDSFHEQRIPRRMWP